ncbi:MAG: NAD(P)-binding domain-containing protein, partial [Nitrospirota bacterium]
MTKKVRLGMIGCGQMSEALLRGVLSAKLVSPEQVLVSDPADDRRTLFVRSYGVRACADNRQAAERAELLLLAVKPQVAGAVLSELQGAVGAHTLVLSVITGVRLVRIEAELGKGARVVRAVPNTPVLVGAGVTAIAGGVRASPADVRTAADFFGAVGAAIEVQ